MCECGAGAQALFRVWGRVTVSGWVSGRGARDILPSGGRRMTQKAGRVTHDGIVLPSVKIGDQVRPRPVRQVTKLW